MDRAAAAAFVAALRDRGRERKSATKCEQAEQQQQQQRQRQRRRRLREGELARGQEGGGDLERKLALELKLQQTEETKVAEEQEMEQEMEQEKSRAGDLERLKALRALIQQDPRNVEALAEAGLVAVLVERIRSSPHTEQVFVLQIMAALGFMVQKSPGRIAEALEAGVIEAIVSRLLTPSSSEGVLLLAVQVLVFLVENKVALHHFLACNIQDALIVVLERGCVRSSLLNARVANLLSRVCELTPGTAHHVYVSLLRSISATTAAIENHTSHAKDHASVTSPGNLAARQAQIDNRCITLCQGLGYLLDNQLITNTASQQVFEAGFIDIFVRLLSQHRIISSHLLETATWTIAYAISGSTDRAALLGQHSRAQDLVLIVRRTHRLEDGAVHAYSSLMSSMIGALSTTDRATALAVTARLMSCLMAVDVATADRSNLERSRDRDEVDRIILRAQHTTGNALRVVRRIAKLGGTALEVLLEGGLFKGIVSLLARSQAYSECLRADLLQEIGLLVEHSPRLGLHMALAGALDELKVAVERSVTVQELCNATRALACFVEHNTPQGLRITDMALAKACDEVLVRILIERDARKTNYEVLLNTVGGLGYLNKRQSTHAGDDVPLSPTSGATAHTDAAMRKRYVEASTALVSLLRDSEASGDSLVWNSLWTLIYMMHGPFASACIKAVHQADGVALLSSIITTNGKNQPLVCSAAKALYEVVRAFPQGILDSMPLNVRLKVLACAARARPLSSTGEVDMSRTLAIAVDPENILESTMCKLETVHGDSLRASALKIQYVSGDVEQVGIDAGGVRRDWLSRLSRDLFNPNFGLVIAGFHPNDSVQLSPDPSFAGMSMEDQQRWYMLMGRVLGLSVLYGDPLGTALVPSWCKLLLEEEPDFNDIRYVSKQYFSTFSSLRELRETDPLAFAASLRDLTFTVNSRELMMKEAFERDTDTPPVSPMRLLKPKVASMLSSSKLLTAHSPPTSLESITTMSELHNAMQVARVSQDRNQLRRLLLLQNTLLAKQKDLLTRPASETKRARRLSAVSETSSVAMEDLGSPTLKRPRFRSASTDETGDLVKSPCHFGDAQDDESKAFFRGVGPIDKEEENHLDEDQDDVDDDEEGASEDEKRMQRMMSTLYDGGDAEEINPGNFNRYLEMLTYKLLVENVAQQLALVKRGFHEIVPRKLALLLLRPSELQSLIEGDRDISIERWKANTIYKGNGNVDDADQIRWFWEYASDLAKEDRQKLLLWATGWRAIGQTGFAHRPFTVEVTSVESPAENERLPSVATCSFHLWIPKYSSKSQLVRKFSLALQEASFGNC